MKPPTPRVFYEDADVILWHGDNQEVLAMLPADSVDVVVTSPPYNTGMVGNGHLKPSGFRKESAMARNLEKMTGGYADTIDEEEYQNQQVSVLDQLARVLKPDGSVFYNVKVRWRNKKLIHPLAWVSRATLNLRMEFIWDRAGMGLTLNARRPYDQDERIYWLFKEAWRWNQKAVGIGSVWRIAPQPYKEHACVFPEALVGHCLSCVARAGDVVLDCYAGAGTVALAARKFGCKAILIEAEEKYCEVIVKRLAQATLPIFSDTSDQNELL